MLEPVAAWWPPGRSPQVTVDQIEEPPPQAPVVDEKEATKLGCELLGEGFVLGVGICLLAAQTQRDWADEAENEAKVESNERRVKTLEKEQAVLRERLAGLERELEEERTAKAKVKSRKFWWL